MFFKYRCTVIEHPKFTLLFLLLLDLLQQPLLLLRDQVVRFFVQLVHGPELDGGLLVCLRVEMLREHTFILERLRVGHVVVVVDRDLGHRVLAWLQPGFAFIFWRAIFIRLTICTIWCTCSSSSIMPARVFRK